MAQTEPKQSTGTPAKRLATAKVKRPETEEEKKRTKADRKKTMRNIAISVFAVLLVLSMMVPSLASIVSNARNAQAASQTQTAEITTETIDALFASSVEELEKTLSATPDDKETILGLAKQYLSWGYMTGVYVTEEGAAEHSKELLDTSRDYFDRYLAIEDSPDVRANRALCSLYAGNITDAQSELEAIVAEHPDCAEAWANLGMVYEMINPDAARDAYEHAVAADTTGSEDGPGTFAQSRLDELNGETTAEAEGEATEGTSETESEASDTNN